MPNVLAANFSRVRRTHAVSERGWSGMNALVVGRMFMTASGVCLGLITPLQISYQETGSEASSFGGAGGGGDAVHSRSTLKAVYHSSKQ